MRRLFCLCVRRLVRLAIYYTVAWSRRRLAPVRIAVRIAVHIAVRVAVRVVGRGVVGCGGGFDEKAGGDGGC